MEKGLIEKTGHSLDYWINLVQKSGLEKHAEILIFLKREHGFTHGYANFVSLKARGSDAGSHTTENLLANQYGKKQHMQSWYHKLVEKIVAFGEDVEVVPKKANVSLRRKRQFAIIQPSTASRMDLGLKFNDQPNAGRLEASGPFGTMCSHRIQILKEEDINEEVFDWLHRAYLEAG